MKQKRKRVRIIVRYFASSIIDNHFLLCIANENDAQLNLFALSIFRHAFIKPIKFVF